MLCILSDCCYSGHWVEDCAKCLDELGIGACGHQAIKHGMLLKVLASCQPNQKATLESFVTQKGIHFDDHDHKMRFYTFKKLSDTQSTRGIDFTEIRCFQLKGPTAPCLLPDIPAKYSWTWKDIVLEYEKTLSSLVYTVRGKDRGRDAWHIVFVERRLLDAFKEKVTTGNIDVADYGHVIKSGWGKDPPDDILKALNKYGP